MDRKREGVIIMTRCLAWVLTMIAGKDSSGLDVVNMRVCGIFRDAHEAFRLLDLKLRRQRFCRKQRFRRPQLGVINVLGVDEIAQEAHVQK